MEVVWLGTRYWGTVVDGTGTVTLGPVDEARLSWVEWFKRASTKYASGVVPWLVTLTLTVLVLPAVSWVEAESGRPWAVAVAGVWSSVTVMGTDSALPDTWL